MKSVLPYVVFDENATINGISIGDHYPQTPTSSLPPAATTIVPQYKVNMSSYSAQLPSPTPPAGTGYNAEDPEAPLVFGNRQEIESVEETKLKDSTVGQLWIRGLVTFSTEFKSDLIYYTSVLVGTSCALNFTQTSLLNLALVFVICSVYVRDNAGHLDPLNTVALVVAGKYGLPWYFSVFHFLAQALAALIATLITWGLTPGLDRSLGLGYETLQAGYTPGQGFTAQMLGSFVQYNTFLWLVCSAGQRNFYEQTGGNYKMNTIFSLAIAFSHMGSVLSFGRIAGCNFGWYLHFFPILISGTTDTSNWWIFFIAPPVALSFTLLLYYYCRWLENMAWQTSYKKGPKNATKEKSN